MLKNIRKFSMLLSLLPVILSVQSAATPAWIGNILGNSIPANFATYWNQITSENAAKWGAVEASRDSMNWGMLDIHFNFAQSMGFPYNFHCLIWGSAPPSWTTSISASDMLAEIIEWFQAVNSRYAPDMVTVVNEPIHLQPVFRNALGGTGSTGWDWVIRSFELARQYLPHSKLHINEYGVVNDDTLCDKYITIIRLLKERNLIDGIGIQCHVFYMNTISVSTLQTNLDKLAQTGVPLYISELDMSGDDTTQLDRYKEKFPLLYNHPGVAGITLWGYIQGQTWKDRTHLVSSGALDAAERPALQWLKPYLFPSINPTPIPTATPVVIPGDVNSDGVITIVDALMTAQYSTGLNPAGFLVSAADVNCDGVVNIIDALIIARFVVGSVTSFC